MRERSSPQVEFDAKAPARPHSVLPPAAASDHLSPVAILVDDASPTHSLGSPRVVVSCVFSDSLGGLWCLSGCSCSLFCCVKQVGRERGPSWFSVKPLLCRDTLFEGGREPSPFHAPLLSHQDNHFGCEREPSPFHIPLLFHQNNHFIGGREPSPFLTDLLHHVKLVMGGREPSPFLTLSNP